MNRDTRPCVAIVAADDDATMLAEWATAAGFDSVRLDSAVDGVGLNVCATLVRWPVELSVHELPRPVILLYEPGAELQATVGGVGEVVELPDRGDVSSLLAWSASLGAMLWSLAAKAGSAAPDAAPAAPLEPISEVAAAEPSGERETGAAQPRLIAVGISTGGPVSLRTLFEGLQAGPQLPPIVIVQHIPPAFVEDLVLRLRDQTGYDVRFADDNTRLMPGVAYIAPGDHHMRVRSCAADLYLSWDDSAPRRGHIPSVEVLFESCARLEGHGVALMMTGMGRDGATAMLQLRQQGWATVGQDAATCTIYGMPGAAMEVGAIQKELPLEEIAPWVHAYCRSPQRV